MAAACRATWARSRPDVLTVTGNGMRPELASVTPPAGVPTMDLLIGTGWHAVPGQRWREAEFSDGVWEIAVFRFPGETR